MLLSPPRKRILGSSPANTGAVGVFEVENWAFVANPKPVDREVPAPLDAGGDEEFDPWVDPHLPAQPKVTVAELAGELRKLLRRGLPATIKTAGDTLPRLRSVIARSIHPNDPVSRLASLNQLLVRVLVEFDDNQYGPGARILFAIAQGTRGTTLTARRERAAEALGYEATHLRKRIEPTILEQVATTLYEDLLRYKRRVRRAPTSEEPTGDTPHITSDDFTHLEELVSRIWQHVYGLRARTHRYRSS